MKILVLVLTLISGYSFAQTIRIADNNASKPAGAHVYATLQAAINDAVAGDIVYVQPSLTTYGAVIIDRPITLRGIGFNTGKDIAYTSIVGNITLTNNAPGTSNASGTTIEGIIFDNIYLGTLTGSFTYTLQNIVITNCQGNRVFRQGGYQNAQNITVKNSIIGIHFDLTNINQLLVYNNYLLGATSAYYGGCQWSSFFLGGGSITNVIISNNIIAQDASNGISGSVSGLVFANNDILGGTVISSRFIRNQGVGGCYNISGLYDATVSNNIFYGCAPSAAATTFERNAFFNNLSYGTAADALPPAGSGAGNSGSGNVVAQDPKFTNAPYNTAYTSSMDFTLQATSPAKNAGADGTDIGITGGAYPVTAGNIILRPTSMPVIITLNPTAITPQGQPVKTSIKAKGN